MYVRAVTVFLLLSLKKNLVVCLWHGRRNISCAVARTRDQLDFVVPTGDCAERPPVDRPLRVPGCQSHVRESAAEFTTGERTGRRVQVVRMQDRTGFLKLC